MTNTICDTCELYLYHCRGWMMRERGCDLAVTFMKRKKKANRSTIPL
jgi:hypothetical protein